MRRRAWLALGLLGLAGCAPIAREFIQADGAPPAIGPYSHAVRAGDWLFVSGQIGIDPATGELAPGGVEAETRQALRNLAAVLTSAGYAPSHVVQAQVFLADMNDFSAVNALYAEFFGPTRPARATVQVARLPRDARIEIQLTALK